MKMRITVIFMVALLTGCTASSSPQLSSDGVETVVGKVPTSCEISEVINVFSAQVPGSRYIPTQWQPSPDTDLAAAIRNQGIACTYGIQEAEVGGTILWASNSKNIWDERKPFWSSEGETPIDLPGIEETSAYILNDGTSADEMHVWRINVLIRGVWIQIGASFLQNLNEALPIIKASIAALDK